MSPFSGLLNLVFLWFFNIFSFVSLANILFIFVLALLSSHRKNRYTPYSPKVSVIIPTYNERDNISRCLKSIFENDYDKNKIEVICADDGSQDETVGQIRKLGHKNIKILHLRHLGKSAAISSGLKHISNEIVIILDADSSISNNFIKNVVLPFKDPDVGCAYGIMKIESINKFNLWESYQLIEYSFLNLVRISSSVLFDMPLWFAGLAVTYRASALKKVGGFSEDNMSEDLDVSIKLAKMGYKGVYVPEAEAKTFPMYSLKNLVKQRMRWFYGVTQNVFKHKLFAQYKSPYMTYLFYSYFFWVVGSFFWFVQKLVIFILSLQSGLFNALEFLLISNTILTTSYGLYLINTSVSQDLMQIVYLILSICLIVLLMISIQNYGERSFVKNSMAFVTYYFYLSVLQGCLILSFIYYPLTGIKKFERK